MLVSLTFVDTPGAFRQYISSRKVWDGWKTSQSILGGWPVGTGILCRNLSNSQIMHDDVKTSAVDWIRIRFSIFQRFNPRGLVSSEQLVRYYQKYKSFKSRLEVGHSIWCDKCEKRIFFTHRQDCRVSNFFLATFCIFHRARLKPPLCMRILNPRGYELDSKSRIGELLLWLWTGYEVQTVELPLSCWRSVW